MTKLEKAIKELRWLQFNFPWQDNPENDADKMCNAIHKYAGDAIELLESQQWVSVKDRLPEPGKNVLTLDSMGNYFIGSFTPDTGWNEQECEWNPVKWWMLLPEPPKEGESE